MASTPPTVFVSVCVILGLALTVASTGDHGDCTLLAQGGPGAAGVVALVGDHPLSSDGLVPLAYGAPIGRSIPFTSEVLPGVRTRRSGLPRTSTRAWISVVRSPREMPVALARVPICPTGAAVSRDVAAVDLTGLRDPAFLHQCRQDAGPDASAAPPVSAIVDRRRRAVFSGAIRPPTAAFEHANGTRDHPAIIDPSRSGLVLRRVRLDGSPSAIR